MKRVFFLLPILALLFAGATIWWYSLVKPASNETILKGFLIVKGSSATQIGNKLESEGFIKSALAFKIYVQITGKAKRMQAGEYRLSPSYPLFKMVDELTRGPVEIWVTIPEGLRREEVAARFASAFGRGEDFIQEFLSASNSLEGFLFPDTYLFPKDSPASLVVNKMRSTFDIKTAELTQGIEASELTLREIVILASIIERETKTDEERPVVAGVLVNRLSIGMGLQADATVQYAVATNSNWWPVLTKDDLAI
ncbi:endolytic transglycosylase MltG, partial [Candidatus Woesebacteria bacterium]|nr:endolytic transglycosylase MltG [Candidatus Woesebacteria bacterium]